MDASPALNAKGEAAGVPSSPCWNKAQQIFLTEFRNSRRFSEAAATEFLNSNYRIDKAINSCLALKSKADQEYGSKRGQFASKLLNTLRTVKDVGDSFLEFAPESVSIAWSAVSLLIKVGTDDLDKCELISRCCENIVTIVLNCRLYENRYNTARSAGDALQDVEQNIMSTIPNLLYLILDFSWHTQYHLDKSRLVRSFKECFSTTLKDKIEALAAEYQKLRSIAEDAFQETVIEQLSSIASKLDNSLSELRENLFPSLKDIGIKIEAIDEKIENIDTRFRIEELRETFSNACRKFNSSEAQLHLKMFLTTFEHIKGDYKDMSLWLFSDQHYQDWEDLGSRTTSLFCLTGPRGFGKSVTMSCVIKRLQKEATGDTKNQAFVLFFYFKKGDENLKSTRKALKSLVSQLLNQKAITDEPEMLKQCIEILEASTDMGVYDLGNITTIFRQLAELVGRPIFIVVDAIDECEDRTQERLIHWLKDMCRSPTSLVKIICSSRDNINIESLLRDLPPTKTPGQLQDGTKGTKSDLPTDIKMVQIDEKINEIDLRMYLMKKVESIVLRRVGKEHGPKYFDHELERIVNIIQTKAGGNFTYATMVVANLQQPTKSTLETKLLELPPAMEGMYRRSLEVLTPDEQELVAFALKWVVWGGRDVPMLVVIEHYKGVYHSKDKPNYDLPSPKGENPSQSPAVRGIKPVYNPYSNLEISETRYHLRSSGRDFFQIDDLTDSIDAHLSVIEWIQSEAKQFAETMNKPKRPVFKTDDNGEWILSLLIPTAIAQKNNSIAEISNRREANLSITIDILRSLNNPTFQEHYMPWNPPGDLNADVLEFWEYVWYKGFPDGKLQRKEKKRDEGLKWLRDTIRMHLPNHLFLSCQTVLVHQNEDDNKRKENTEAGKEILDALIKHGADVNAQTYNSRSPLDCAVGNGDLEGVAWLLENGADIQDDDYQGDTCLHTCVTEELNLGRWGFQRMDIAKKLIEAGIDITRKNESGETALFRAIGNQDEALIQYLLDICRTKYPNHDYLLQQNLHSEGLLHTCARNVNGGKRIVDMLLVGLSETEKSRLIDIADTDSGETPLHVAVASRANPEMVEYLVALKPDGSRVTFEGHTALDLYVEIICGDFHEPEAVERCMVALLSVTPSACLDIDLLLRVAFRYKATYMANFLKGKCELVEIQETPDEDGWTIFHEALCLDTCDVLRTCFPNDDFDAIYENLPVSKTPTRFSDTRRGGCNWISDDGFEVRNTAGKL
ncbi:hypothetical protein ABW20_dc0104489 [Dactylellina cionopaga]|nr:hypothetical protein ABW20_dc0104489 [Dactylellina cionopaga]